MSGSLFLRRERTDAPRDPLSVSSGGWAWQSWDSPPESIAHAYARLRLARRLLADGDPLRALDVSEAAVHALEEDGRAFRAEIRLRAVAACVQATALLEQDRLADARARLDAARHFTARLEEVGGVEARREDRRNGNPEPMTAFLRARLLETSGRLVEAAGAYADLMQDRQALAPVGSPADHRYRCYIRWWACRLKLRPTQGAHWPGLLAGMEFAGAGTDVFGLAYRWAAMFAIHEARLDDADELLARSSELLTSDQRELLLGRFALAHLYLARGDVSLAREVLAGAIEEAWVRGLRLAVREATTSIRRWGVRTGARRIPELRLIR